MRGMRVLALDRVGPGAQTSARAAGQSVIAQTDPAMGQLMHRSIETIAGFEDNTGVPFKYHQVGSIKYALADWSASQLSREVERARLLGADVSMVALDDAQRIAPHTNADVAVAAWHAPNDLYFSPPDMLAAFYSVAKKAGVEFQFGEDVSDIVIDAGKVAGVVTGSGRIDAGAVVMTTGPWTKELLARTGTILPAVYVRHQYSIRSGVPGIHPGLPSVRIVDHAVYARPVGANLMFGTYEPHPLEFKAVPKRAEDVPLDGAAIETALQKVNAVFRGLAGSSVVELRGGVPTMTPDGSYLIDEVEVARGLYFATGCNVMGLSCAPALGEEMAAWLATGQRPEVLKGFSIRRFADRNLSSDEIRRKALGEYEGIYRDTETAGHIRRYGALPGNMHAG
nr:FAD-binding oxidoreductase [Mesorhizobium sp. WSM4875]WIE94838.1 FAD-binding oxidoreductase [Mesorhizobium sp. WSM4875]